MEPPKCQYCGKKEWRHACSGLPDIVSRAVEIQDKRGPGDRDIASQGRSPKPRAGLPDKSRFDRTAYQREFMRKKRARMRSKEGSKERNEDKV